MSEKSFLAQSGQKLIDQGYDIVPIKRGYKYPRGLKDWQNTTATSEKLAGWLANGFADGGTGILCGKVSGVDLDILDHDVCETMIGFVEKLLGTTIKRVGKAPKILLVFRTNEPFAKITSKTYIDFLGNEHRVEILGIGQQFVTHAIHPDTKKPYEWIGKDITDTPINDLPAITQPQAQMIAAHFENIAPTDWELKPHTGSEGKVIDPSIPEPERAIANAAPKTDLNNVQIAKCLDVLKDNSEDYHEWVEVGMALYHQYDGSNDGLEMWDTWSQNSGKYVSAEIDKKWRSFKANLSSQRPKTFATIIKKAKEAHKEILRQSQPKQTAFKLIDAAAVVKKLGPVKWRVKGFLEQDMTGLLFGEPGSFKSFIVLDMAFHVAAGLPWHGSDVTQGPVVYIAGEGHAGLARRFAAWQKHHGVDLAELPFYVSEQAARLYDKDSAAEVVAAVDAVAALKGPPAMVIIDTLARNFGGGDENSNTDTNIFLNHVDGLLRARFGATVIVVHHTGHSHKERARGASALKGGMDFEYRVDKPDDTMQVRMVCTKMKNTKEPSDVWFEGREILVGTMDDEEMTSLIFEKTAAPVAEEPELKGLQLALFEVIEKEAPVERETLREIAISEGVIENSTQFRNTLAQLLKKEIISEIDNKINPVDGIW